MTHYRSRVARAAVIVMAGYVASKAVALLRDRVIAQTFGTGAALDAYYAAFNLPDLLFTLIAGGALATALIPVLAEYLTLEERGQERAWQLSSNVLTVILLATAALAAVVALLAGPLVAHVIAPGFTPEQAALSAGLMRIILISTIIFSASGTLMGVLNARQHFFSPAFAPLFYNLGIIVGALVFARRLPPERAVYGLAWGVVLGAGLHLLSHTPALIQHQARLRPQLDWRDPGLRQVLRLMGPRVLALGVIKVNLLVQGNLASRLDEGSLSALTFAWGLMQLPETIFATAIATAVFPTLAELAGRRELETLRRTMMETLRAILALTIPAAVGLIVLGRSLIALLFQGGAFGNRSTDAVFFALQFYALGLIAHSLLEVVARTFYAQKDTKTPLYIAVGAMGLNFVLAVALLDSLRHGGLALANSLAVGAEVLAGLWLLRGRLRGLEARATLRALAQIAVAAAVMGVAVWAWTVWQSGANVLTVGIGGAMIGVATYALVGLALGVEELRLVPALLLRRRRAPVGVEG